MTIQTNVPAITFSPTGFVPPPTSSVLSGVQEDMQFAFGGKLNFTTTSGSVTNSTPQAQLCDSLTAIIDNNNQGFCNLTALMDPAYSYGRWQDGIGRIYFITRFPALPTVISVSCIGAQGVQIPTGALIEDSSGFEYTCTEGGTIPASGNVTLNFANTQVGPNPIPESNSVSIVQVINGWDAVTCTGGTIGQNEENRSQFEQRRAATVDQNAFGPIGPVIGAVSKVPGIVDYFGYDNGTSTTVAVNGVNIPPNSMYICVAPGSATNASVAQAIFSKKAPGCSTFGSTNAVAYDNNPLYTAPVPYTINFQIATFLQILVQVNLVAGPTVPSDAATQVQNQIIAAFAGSVAGVPRARINSLLLADNLASAIRALGTWVKLRSLYLGSNNSPGATFNATIAGTALTVTGGLTGTIAIGQTISDAGGVIPEGTTIVSGSGTSWVISQPVTIGSPTAITAAVASLSQLQVQANQEPEAVAANIQVNVT